MKNNKLIVGIISVILGLLAGALLMTLIGNNPFTGYTYLFKGGLMSIERVGNTLATATPIILTGLSVAFAFKTGLFNIGASGQMLMGGLFATAIALTLNLPKAVMLPIIILASMIGGGIWGIVPGYLKAKFNVHEVVATIMMNWIAYWIVYYTIPAYFKGQSLETESRLIPEYSSLKLGWLTELFNGSYINLGFFIAVIVVIIISVILNRTVTGFRMKATGFNKDAALYSGMNVNQNIVLSMVIAGALSGLAGATFYVGYASNMQIGILPTAGFDGIAVALLGANNPYGALAGAIFFGLLHSGKGFMSAMTDIPPEIGDTIIATIIYFSAVSVLIERGLNKLTLKLKEKK
ncbi:ABC transporter permease [Thiospirochaeta perfilievii]|uniref:ABC transporter permease n=1 Tax=Thiospirochaeta perfilievii TaxID=252967 RepID=A0A5C1QDJ7_9SPIO|nr:ABC transporter permease [Thiospirochaeta perfilievii]QEN06143.1 ABC transporter permease [Thiospirochaeta perfilievii]